MGSIKQPDDDPAPGGTRGETRYNTQLVPTSSLLPVGAAHRRREHGQPCRLPHLQYPDGRRPQGHARADHRRYGRCRPCMKELYRNKTLIWTLLIAFTIALLFALGARTLVPPDE